MLNSRGAHFTATSLRMLPIVAHKMRHPFFRSYGARLQSSLRTVLSSALGHLSSSTCVGLRYGHLSHSLISFSRQCGISKFIAAVALTPRHPSSALRQSTGLDTHIQQRDCLAYCVPDKLVTQNRWYPNINGLSITYAFRPWLRTD